MVFKRRDRGKVRVVFKEPFVMDSIRIDRKLIKNYIHGRAEPVLGSDFFYSYLYRDGILTFAALESDEYEEGKLPLVMAPLLSRGRYFLESRKGSTYYLIDTTKPVLSLKVSTSIPEGYSDIRDISIPDASDIPSSMFLRWSLKREKNIIFFLASLFFAASIFFYTLSYFDCRSLSSLPPAAPLDVKRFALKRGYGNRVPDCSEIIKKIGDWVEGRGIIESIIIKGGKIRFLVELKGERDRRVFLKKFGGRYEGGKIVYTAPLSACRIGGSGGQSSRAEKKGR